MIGASPDKVVVKPNLSFVEAGLSPQDAQALVGMWQNGVVSYQPLYAKRDECISKLDGTLRKTLVDDGLTKALIDAGVSKDFLPAAKALLKERGAVKLVEEDGEFQVLADDGIDERMPLGKFVTNWTADDDKHFIAKPTGGDAKGGEAKRFSENPFDPKNPNRTKQQELIVQNGAKARQIAEAVVGSLRRPLPGCGGCVH